MDFDTIGQVSASWIFGNPLWRLFLMGFAATSAWPVGKKAFRFAGPKSPYLSPFVSAVGWLIMLVGRAWTTVVVLAAIIVPWMLNWEGFDLAEVWHDYGAQCNSIMFGAACGVVFAGVVYFRVLPFLAKGDGLPDIRSRIKTLTGVPMYDPVPYVQEKRGVFLGLTDDGKPLYVPWNRFQSTHVQIPGASGFGKGVTLGLLAYQTIAAGQSTIIFDPKPDDFLLAVAARSAAERGVPLHVFNLRQGQPPQLNPIAGATRFELEEMLIGGLDLFDTGDESDHHRGNDRDAAEAIASLADAHNTWSFPELFPVAAQEKSIFSREGFWRKFRHLAGLSAISTNVDVDFAGIIARGEPIYIVGATTRDPKVTMLQKLLLVRFIQLIEKRQKSERAPVHIFLDEFKHQISSVALTGLGTVRGFNAHVILAHQSFGDLLENQALNPEAVKGAVIDNTTLKIVYHLKDAELAQRLSDTSGMVRTHLENVSAIDPENPKDVRSWQEANIPVIEPGIFMHLPSPIGKDGRLRPAVGIVFGDDIARTISISPVMSDVAPPDVVERPFVHGQEAQDQCLRNDVAARPEDLI